MRELRFPRLGPIEPAPTHATSRTAERRLPKCGHPHPHHPVTCVLDQGHRAALHAAPNREDIHRW